MIHLLQIRIACGSSANNILSTVSSTGEIDSSEMVHGYSSNTVFNHSVVEYSVSNNMSPVSGIYSDIEIHTDSDTDSDINNNKNTYTLKDFKKKFIYLVEDDSRGIYTSIKCIKKIIGLDIDDTLQGINAKNNFCKNEFEKVIVGLEICYSISESIKDVNEVVKLGSLISKFLYNMTTIYNILENICYDRSLSFTDDDEGKRIIYLANIQIKLGILINKWMPRLENMYVYPWVC